MDELWKPLLNFEELYEVSNQGKIRSLKEKFMHRVLKPSLSNSGYQQVILRKNNKNHCCFIHRAVAEAFILNPEKKEQVNHIDYDKHNNNVSNLEWTTRSENQTHAYASGVRNWSNRYAKHRFVNGERIVTKKDNTGFVIT